MRRAIVPRGWGRSRNREYAGGPSFTTNNWMRCVRCVSKCGGSCWPRARNTQPGETALSDSCDWSDPVSGTAGHSADSAPLPQQAAAVDLQRIWHRDTKQRRSPECRRTAGTSEETELGSRTEPQLQSRSEESVPGRGDRGREQTGSVAGVLQRFAEQGHATGDGATDLGQKDCHHRVDRVEERSVLRSPTSETTNSLSVWGSLPLHHWGFLWRWPAGSRGTLVRERGSAG